MLFWISFGVYCVGCVLAMWVFLEGRSVALNKRDWHWPVVFLWPLLLFWPVHALTRHFVRWKARKSGCVIITDEKLIHTAGVLPIENSGSNS